MQDDKIREQLCLGISVSNFPAFYEHNRERRNLLNGSKRLRKVEVRDAE